MLHMSQKGIPLHAKALRLITEPSKLLHDSRSLLHEGAEDAEGVRALLNADREISVSSMITDGSDRIRTSCA